MIKSLLSAAAVAALLAGVAQAQPAPGGMPPGGGMPAGGMPAGGMPPGGRMGPMPKFVPPNPSPAMVEAGTYMVEPAHTQVVFSVAHMGTSTYYMEMSGVSGSLVLDPKNAAMDQLDISIPVSSVTTTSDRLTGEIKSPMFLDAKSNGMITFHSTKVTMFGKRSAKVTGDLTLHGVTKPVTLTANFVAGGPNAMMHNTTIGFDVSGTIKRSDFGVTIMVPMISDDVKLMIAAVFAK